MLELLVTNVQAIECPELLEKCDGCPSDHSVEHCIDSELLIESFERSGSRPIEVPPCLTSPLSTILKV